MSTSKPSSADSPSATRQMLDELDSLMERMLALPANDLDDPLPAPPPAEALAPSEADTDAAPMPPGPRFDPPEPNEPSRVLVGRLSASDIEPDEPMSSPASEDEPFSYSDVEEPPAQDSVLSAGDIAEPASAPVDAPAETSVFPAWDRGEPVPSAEDVLPPLIIQRPLIAVPPRTFPTRPSVATWALQPLLWINQGFDRLTKWIGPPGQWLRSPSGRAMLGYGGLGLLGLAAAWLLRDWLGLSQ